jgi:hypothetical protein
MTNGLVEIVRGAAPWAMGSARWASCSPLAGSGDRLSPVSHQPKTTSMANTAPDDRSRAESRPLKADRWMRGMCIEWSSCKCDGPGLSTSDSEGGVGEEAVSNKL